jgi:hypothetical protein
MQHDRQRRRVITTLVMAIALTARAAAAGSISLQWDPNAELDVQGYRVFVGEQPGVYTSSVDVGNVTNWAYASATEGKRYCFAVAAYSAGPRMGAKSAEVCTEGIADDAPTLLNPGNLTHSSGQPLTLTLVGSDPEGNPVTYTASGLPTGLVLNRNTGFVSGTPSAAGAFTTRATVSDGKLTTTQSFSWKIQAAAPGTATPLRPAGTIATATPTFEWESVPTATSYRLWADDASTKDLLIDYTPAQAGCTTAGAVCRVSPGVALVAGRASWSVRSSNPVGGAPWSGALDFTIQLPAGSGGSKAPMFKILTPSSTGSHVSEVSAVSLSGTADAAVTQISWSSSRGPSGSFPGAKLWKIGPMQLPVGSTVLTVTARDSAGNAVTEKLRVTVSDTIAPTLTVKAPVSTTSAASISLVGTVKDNFGAPRVSWTSDRDAGGEAYGTPNWSAKVALKDGENVITVSAEDGSGNRSTKILTVTKTGGSTAAAPRTPAASSTANSGTSLPKLSLTYPTTASKWTTPSRLVRLRGNGTDNVTRVVWSSSSGDTGVARGTDKWTTGALALEVGVNKITLTAVDANGRTDRQVLTITYRPQ